MTLRDLVKKFFEGRAPGLWSESDKDIKGMRAVVQALRDEYTAPVQGCETVHASMSRYDFNEILGDAGEKVAGGSTREDEKAVEAVGDKGPVSVNSPATDAAPAVCVWTLREAGWERSEWQGCELVWRTYTQSLEPTTCPSCGKPIKFTEANHG